MFSIPDTSLSPSVNNGSSPAESSRGAFLQQARLLIENQLESIVEALSISSELRSPSGSVGASPPPTPQAPPSLAQLIQELLDGDWSSDPHFIDELMYVLENPGQYSSSEVQQLLKLLGPMLSGGTLGKTFTDMIVDYLYAQSPPLSQNQIQAYINQIAGEIGAVNPGEGSAFQTAADQQFQWLFSNPPPYPGGQGDPLLALDLKNLEGEVLNNGLNLCYRDAMFADPNKGLLWLFMNCIMGPHGVYADMAYTLQMVNEEEQEIQNILNEANQLSEQLKNLLQQKPPLSQGSAEAIVQQIASLEAQLKTFTEPESNPAAYEALGGANSPLLTSIQQAAGAFDNALASSQGNDPAYPTFANLLQQMENGDPNALAAFNSFVTQLQNSSGTNTPQGILNLSSSLTGGINALTGRNQALSMAIQNQEQNVDTLIKLNATVTSQYATLLQFLLTFSGT